MTDKVLPEKKDLHVLTVGNSDCVTWEPRAGRLALWARLSKDVEPKDGWELKAMFGSLWMKVHDLRTPMKNVVLGVVDDYAKNDTFRLKHFGIAPE